MGGNTVKTQKKECAMKNKSKITKAIAIGLFVVAFLLNVSLTFDNGNSQNADLSLGSLKISLFQKAYACGPWCIYHPPYDCVYYYPDGNLVVEDFKPYYY